MSARTEAALAYVQALRTAENSAASRAISFLSEDVVLVHGADQWAGRDKVARRITGQWPMTPVFYRAVWADPVERDGRVEIGCTAEGIFAPSGFTFSFGFDANDCINRVEQQTLPWPEPLVTEVIPDFVRTLVNGALANGTPMVIASTDETGEPILSLRGATQDNSDTQLSVWLRHAEGDTVKSIRTNPKMAALYRDSRVRNTLIFHGRGRIVEDEAVRNRVFDIAPEVEQNHDPDRLGAALLIDVDRLDGQTTRGAVRMRRTI